MANDQSESKLPAIEKKGYQVLHESPKVQGGYQGPTGSGQPSAPPKDGSSGKK